MNDTQDGNKHEEQPPSNVPDSGGGSWSSKRKAIAYQEARAVLSGQRATAENIDKKGLRTTQFIIALAGAFASVIKVLSLNIIPELAYTSIVLGLIALAASLATYNTSRTVLGPDQAYLEWFTLKEFDETSWEDQLLKEMGQWISQNSDRIELNVHLLLASNAALLGAVVALMASMTI